MKKILISIRPQWVAKMLNGEKTIEVRKGTALYNVINRLIKEQGKAPCLVYCTMGKPTLLPKNRYRPWFAITPYGSFEKNPLNGKVVAEFEASAEEIFSEGLENGCGGYNYSFYTGEIDDIREKSCLDEFELRGYLGEKRGGEVVGTAIHVKPGTMKTDGFPKNLSDYGIKRAPQSWCYAEAEE